MILDWLHPIQQRVLTDALLAVDGDTAGAGRVGSALLRQDGNVFLLSRFPQTLGIHR